MKAKLVISVLVAGIICLILGFWLGFRQGWQMELAVEVAPRAVAELQLGRRLDTGHVDEVKYYFDSQVDAALMYWHDVLHSPVTPFLNFLTGGEYFPEYETYIRRLAQYRKTYPSPLWDPKDMSDIDDYLSKQKPQNAADFAAANREAKAAMDEVVSRYAP
jgi:hypothetical protein